VYIVNVDLDSLLINDDETSLDEYRSNANLTDGITSNSQVHASLLCSVCQDRASGRHYGVLSCEVRTKRMFEKKEK
jgi:hypothetical protein